MVTKKDSKTSTHNSLDVVFSLLKKYVPYILLILGISMIFLFVIGKLTVLYGSNCGMIDPKYPYRDTCTCFGNKEVVCNTPNCTIKELKCLGIMSSCQREYFRSDIPMKERDCSLAMDQIVE